MSVKSFWRLDSPLDEGEHWRARSVEAPVNEPASVDIKRLILVPALVTLAVTAARLAGELFHGPRAFFNSAPGGPGAIVGIIWLAPIFGVYFALKLEAQGQGPKSAGRAVGLAFLGVAVIFVFSVLGSRLHIQQSFRGRLLYVCACVAGAALISLPGWSALFRTMVAYAYAARVPVMMLMFFAFWRNWGTHYDALPSGTPAGMGLLAKFMWLDFVPQLVFWVAVTVLAGMLCGSLAAGIAKIARR